MAFNDIKMWADIINSQDIEKTNYELACKDSIRNSGLLESKLFVNEKQTQLDPCAYGFKERGLNESIYHANGISGKIALPHESTTGKFIMEMHSFFPSISVKPLVEGTNTGSIIEGHYDDLLDIWTLNESGCKFSDVKDPNAKSGLKNRFDEAFFSEGCCDEADPLDEKIDLSECGFNEDGTVLDENDDNEYGSLKLEFELSDDEMSSSEQFFDQLKSSYKLDDVTMSNVGISGPYETCTFYGSKKDLREVFAIYNGASTWLSYKSAAGDEADFEFEEAFIDELNEADCREPLSHGLDFVGVKASTANIAEQDGVELALCEKDVKIDEGIGGALGGALIGGIAGNLAGQALAAPDAAEAMKHIGSTIQSPGGLNSDSFKAISDNVGSGIAKHSLATGAGVVGGAVLGHLATSDNKKNESDREFNPDDVASDYIDAHADEYEEMLQADIERQQQEEDAKNAVNGQQNKDSEEERNEAEEFFGINEAEDEQTSGKEAKPFRISWMCPDGKLHNSNIAAIDAKSAEEAFMSNHEGCEVKNIEDLSKVYKQWKQEEMYDDMLTEASLADALGQSQLDALNGLEQKLSDDGFTADQKEARKAKLEQWVANRKRRESIVKRIEDGLKTYSGNKEEISKQLQEYHGLTTEELSLFWKVADLLGYKPTDLDGMTDEDVVYSIVAHIPKGRRQRFQGYIDPMIQNRGIYDNGGGDPERPGHTGNWENFKDSVVPITYRPAELDMMSKDDDIDDRRQLQSRVIQLSRQLKNDQEQKNIDKSMPNRGQKTWLADEVTKLMKSIPRPKARKILSSIIDDIKSEYGITDKYITGKTEAPDDVKEKCAQEILFLKSLFGKDIGIGPTLRDYPVAWGKDSRGQYVTTTTAGQYNDETEFIIGKAMAKVLNVPYVSDDDKHKSLVDIISDEQLCRRFIEELKSGISKRSYGTGSFDKKSSSDGEDGQQ